MSQPIRYGLADTDLGRIHPQADGHLVMWADYAALAAEKADTLMVMAKLHMEYRRLQAENERLRKAGDELYKWAGAENRPPQQVYAAWNAAKEGGDAK